MPPRLRLPGSSWLEALARRARVRELDRDVLAAGDLGLLPRHRRVQGEVVVEGGVDRSHPLQDGVLFRRGVNVIARRVLAVVCGGDAVAGRRLRRQDGGAAGQRRAAQVLVRRRVEEIDRTGRGAGRRARGEDGGRVGGVLAAGGGGQRSRGVGRPAARGLAAAAAGQREVEVDDLGGVALDVVVAAAGHETVQAAAADDRLIRVVFALDGAAVRGADHRVEGRRVGQRQLQVARRRLAEDLGAGRFGQVEVDRPAEATEIQRIGGRSLTNAVGADPAAAEDEAVGARATPVKVSLPVPT